MPELPEVETTCRGIKPYIEGYCVNRVEIRERRLRWPISEEIDRNLPGARIENVSRRAKYLLLETTTGTLIIHLGMSGTMCIVNMDDKVQKHDHVDIVLSSGYTARFTDVRRFGAMLWSERGVDHPRLVGLGPEPLSDEFSGEYLYQLSKRSKRTIKQFIMDSHIVVGVGNIYASESLFYSGIRPDKHCHDISLQCYKRLVESIKNVLQKAIACGGTTLKDFLGGDGKPGYFQQELAVYGRAGESCTKCLKRVEKISLGNRSTYFCRHCQQ